MSFFLKAGMRKSLQLLNDLLPAVLMLILAWSHLLQDADLLAVLGDLLDTDDVDRLTAQETLQQAYFCKCA